MKQIGKAYKKDMIVCVENPSKQKTEARGQPGINNGTLVSKTTEVQLISDISEVPRYIKINCISITSSDQSENTTKKIIHSSIKKNKKLGVMARN